MLLKSLLLVWVTQPGETELISEAAAPAGHGSLGRGSFPSRLSRLNSKEEFPTSNQISHLQLNFNDRHILDCPLVGFSSSCDNLRP